jgi:hypothetical protein
MTFFVVSVPELSHSWNYDQKPPGLILLEEFVTEDEEKSLLNCIDWKTTDSHLGIESLESDLSIDGRIILNAS